MAEHAEQFAGCAAAIGESGGFTHHVGDIRLYPVATAERGTAHLELTAHGRAGHASRRNDANPVIRLVHALHRIAEATAAPGMATGLAVVVSHGAALRLGMSRLLGMPEDLFGVLGPLSNCSWSVLGRRYGRWRLVEHNAGTLPEPVVLSDDR